MFAGRNLRDLAVEIQRQADVKRDYIADSRALRYDAQDVLEMKPNGETVGFGVTDLCHEQIAARLAIPKAYYDRMRSGAPHLLAYNINHWFHETPAKYMIRTLGAQARALLSERYRPLDNFNLAQAVLPALLEAGAKVGSCELTERRLYIKAIAPRIEAEVRKGDVVSAGVVISNSEVGLGAIRVEPMVYRLVCLNGMIVPDYGVKKYHVGRSGGEDLEGAAEFFRDETRQADDNAFWMKVQDAVKATLTQIKFTRIVERLAEATEKKLPGNPLSVVEVLYTRYGLSETEKGSILTHLIEGGDLSAWGLGNAITLASQNAGNYDRATELERLGGQVIELPATAWTVATSTN